MKLRIGFGKPLAWFVPISWAIRLIEGIGYSHTWFEFDDQVFQTTIAAGAAQTSFEKFISQYDLKDRHEFELTPEQFETYRAFQNKYQGTPYGFRKLIGTALARALGLKKNPLATGPETMDCAELLLILIRELPEVFVGQGQIKGDTSIAWLKTLRDFIANNPNARRVP